MGNDNSGYWQERVYNNCTGTSNGCFPTFSLKSYGCLNIIHLNCAKISIVKITHFHHKNMTGFLSSLLAWGVSWYENVTFLAEVCKTQTVLLPLKQPVLLPNNSTALFLAQILDTSRWEKKPSHILPKALLFFDSAQHQSTNTRGGMSIHGCFRGTFFSKPGIYLVDLLSSQLLPCHSTPLQSRIKVWGSFPKVQPRDSSVIWNSHASHRNKAEGKAAKG